MSDATQRTGVIVCLACDSREQVDTWVAKAVAAGGTATRPSQEHGFMDGHGFADPDGHNWALGHMAGKPPQA